MKMKLQGFCLLLCLVCAATTVTQAQANKAKRRLAKIEAQAPKTNPPTVEPSTTTTPPTETIAPPSRLGTAQVRPPNRPMDLGRVPNQILDRVLLRLDLSEEQRPQIVAVRRKYNLEIARLLRLVKAKQDVFDDAMTATEFQPEEIERKADDLAKTQGDLLRTQTRQMIEIRKLLTPEQFARFHQMLEEERRKNLQQRLLNQ